MLGEEYKGRDGGCSLRGSDLSEFITPQWIDSAQALPARGEKAADGGGKYSLRNTIEPLVPVPNLCLNFGSSSATLSNLGKQKPNKGNGRIRGSEERLAAHGCALTR